MRDNISIKKTLFISATNIALVVFKKLEKEFNILFADQINVADADVGVKVNELLTNAANFLGFNIKNVDLVFDDNNVFRKQYSECFECCENNQDIYKEIYKKAKLANIYVNEINLIDVKFNTFISQAQVKYEIVGSNYDIYAEFIKKAKYSNVTISNVSNIYSLINKKKVSSEIIVDTTKDQLVVSSYKLGKLFDIQTIDGIKDEAIASVASQFNVEKQQVKQMIGICNNIDVNEDTDTLVWLNYSLSRRIFEGISAGDLLKSYQKELNGLIANKVNLNDFSEVTVIADEAINKLTNSNIAKPLDIIGLENIDTNKILALQNAEFGIRPFNQYKFELSIDLKSHNVVA